MYQRLDSQVSGAEAYRIITKQKTAYGCYRSEDDCFNAAFGAANADVAIECQNNLFEQSFVVASYKAPRPMFVEEVQLRRESSRMVVESENACSNRHDPPPPLSTKSISFLFRNTVMPSIAPSNRLQGWYVIPATPSREKQCQRPYELGLTISSAKRESSEALKPQ
jgi:hypothetical protein